jgi:predicted ester cyclase
MEASAEDNARVAADYFAAVGRRDLDAMVAGWEPGGQSHIVGLANLTAPDGVRDWFGELFRAYPDFTMEVEKVVADGEGAAVHWSATATFDGSGTFEGLKPNGAKIAVEGIDVLSIRDGRVASITAVINGLDLARQIGAVPPRGSAADRLMAHAFNAKTAAARRTADLAGRIRR